MDFAAVVAAMGYAKFASMLRGNGSSQRQGSQQGRDDAGRKKHDEHKEKVVLFESALL